MKIRFGRKGAWGALGTALGAWLLAGTAHAQPVRPNILVIFDTSGSMTDHDCFAPAWYKDGSYLCGNLGDGSNCASKAMTCDTAASATCADPYDFTKRMYGLKRALSETIAQVGTDEVNFSLMRFPQREDPAIAATCPSETFLPNGQGRYYSAHYYQDASTAVNVAGGDRTGCRISTHNGESTFGTWFTQAVSGKPAYEQAIVVPFAVDQPGANITQLYKWMDNAEAASAGVITDPELRSGNGFYTPLGRSLFYARMYFDNLVKPGDTKAACRKNLVILVTDGNESCDPAGTFLPSTQAAALYASGIETYVVTDTSTGSPNDQIAQAGSNNTRNAIRVALNDSTAVRQALVDIIAKAVPPTEICNGIDDNCNGQTDEAPLPGVGDKCSCGTLTPAQDGVGVCKRGVNMCVNAGIACVGCVAPGTEVCNGIDDNCNGQVDEGFNVGMACSNGLKGVCERNGSIVCTPGGQSACDAPAVAGTAELCNDLDDDCDGMTDEPDTVGGKLPGEGAECGSALGVCMKGQLICDRTAGSLTKGQFVCDQQTMKDTEVCDAKDNDCDGQTDEGLPNIGMVCACKDPAFAIVTDADVRTPANIEKYKVGECKPGTLVCKGREPLDCDGCLGPRKESCNAKDDNCDGMTDEGETCETTRICVEHPDEMTARCEPKCVDGEFPCQPGFECTDSPRGRYCKSSRCNGVECAAGLDCDPEDGICKDKCAGVMCPAPKTCSRGVCRDCYTTGCPTGQLCLLGVCKENLCANKTCAEGEYCSAGTCVSACAAGCPAGQRCIAGACQVDACTGVPCNGTSVCDPTDGMCKADACQLRQCAPGQRCIKVSGQCKDDPCATISCGTCQVCRLTVDGYPVCERDNACGPPPTVEVRKVKVGTGCGCATPGNGSDTAPWGMLVLGLLGVALRRRRR